MPTTLEYMKFSLNVYAASLDNFIAVPFGWDRTNWQPDLPSGFSAGTFVKGNDVVISYTGTNDGGDVVNWAIGLGVPTSQLYQAIDYYFAQKALHPGANITFTGHSLGGGLASVMAVYFNKQATVFDAAPFQPAAINQNVTDLVKDYMLQKGYSDVEFTAYVQSESQLALTRESQITGYFIEDEVLAYIRFSANTLMGQQYVFSMGNTTADPVSRHSMALMLAIQASDTFRDVVGKLPDLVTLLADSNLFGADANNSENTQDLLRKLLRHEFSIAGEITADAMLTRFASDMNKLAQEGGLTMSDSDGFATTDLGNVSKTLIAFAMQMYYEDTPNAKDATKQLFTAVTGGVQFDMADVSQNILTAFTQNTPVQLNDAKGYKEYFSQYLNGAGSNFTEKERNLINGMLHYLRDWYVQAGAGGMTATDSQNRGAFMLGGAGADNLTGGSKADLLVGNAGDDALNGGNGNDLLMGGKGADTLDGGEGSDQLKGGVGNDTLIGGANDDTLDGGLGDDILEGGDGFDTYIINTGDGHDHIVDTGRNRIIFDGKSVNGVFIKDAATGQYKFIGDDGRTLEFHSPGVLTLDADTSITFDNYTNAEDFNNDHAFGIALVENTPTTPETTLDIIGDLKPEDQNLTEEGIQPGYDDLGNIIVTAEAEVDRVDTLYGSAGNDHIQGLGGDDVIYLSGGNDWIQGGAGNDIISGNGGNTLIEGNAGADQLFGGTQDDTIYGGDKLDLTEAISQGATQTASSSKGDWLDGASGDDVLVGAASADVLVAGDGYDILVGGGGDDTMYGDSATLNLPHDWTIQREVIVHADYTEYKVTSNVIDLPSSVGVGGNDNLLGGAGNDWMFGADGDDVMDGGNDNDVLFGQDGMDLLDGGDGNDVLSGGKGDDYIIGGEGNDMLNGESYDTQNELGNDYLDGGNGDDNLNGDAGDDMLQGGDGTDTLFGGAGNDILDGDTGNDYMNGGTGDDIYKITNLEDHDNIEDTSGNDTLAVGIAWDAVKVVLAGTTIGLFWSEEVNKYVAIGNGTSGAINSFEFSDKTLSIAEVLKRIDPEDYNNVTGGAESTTLGTSGALSNMSNTANAPDATSNTAYQIQNAILATVNDAGGVADVVDFGTNVTSSQASYMRLTNDDLVITLDTGAEITIKQHYAVDNTHRIENIQFADVTIDTVTLDSLTPSIATASQGNDILLGTTGDDELYGLAGNDTLKGGTGNDTYIFAQGHSADTIVENDATTANLDTLLLVDIQSTEVSLQRMGSDLVISSTITPNSTDKITIQAFFTSTANEIEQFSFSDGVLLNTAQIKALVKITGTSSDDFLQGYSNSNDRIYGLAGNDYLEGLSGEDVLDGGSGNDVLLGNGGDDIYVFNLGDGRDVIYEEGDTTGDILRFGTGIASTDIIAYISGADLVLSHVNGIDQVTIANWYVSSGYQLKQFEFADGTIWDGNNTGYLGSLRGSAGNDYIYGTAQGETLYGMTGNDTLYSNGGTDILIGGKGNDYLYGNYSNRNTYVFALGDDADTISGVSYLQDTLRFEADIQSTDISAERVGSDLVLRHQNGTDSVTLSNWYLSYTYRLPAVTFAANGTTWSATTLSQMGVNIIHNYALNIGDGIKTIEDWGGTDTLTIGGAISDTDIVISRVGQNLQIAHVNGVDRVTIKDWFNDVAKQVENIVFTSSGTVLTKAQITQNFLTLTGTSGSDVIQGGDAYAETILGLGGNDTLYGGKGEDQITGGAGNDTLYGGDGYDTYYFNQGDGQDTVSDTSYDNALVFGAGLLNQMSTSWAYGQDAVYTFGNGADSVRVKWGSNVTLKFITNGTAQADNITGSAYNEYIYGLSGNDTILGGDGDDWLYGGDGDDLLDGNVLTDITFVGEANAGGGDSYFGGKGNDTLSGNAGVDTYYFNLGDGNDVIIEGSYSNGNNYWYHSTQDTLVLGKDIALENIQVSELNGDLVVKVSATDSVTVRSWFSDYKARVDFIKFDDGRSIGVSDIASIAFTQHGTAGADVLAAGNTYYWGSALYGEAGNDTLNGGNNDDQLHGGSGNDVLNGSYGNDAYYFERGGGQDQIIDSSGADKVYFDASITAANITLNRNGNDLTLTVTNTVDSLTIKGYFVSSTNIVETFIFSDGSSLPSIQAIQDSFLNIRGTSGDDNLLGTAYTNAIYGGDGNDILRGFEGDDILYGDAGNDTLDGGVDYDQLRGGDGNDKYVYAAGGGTDTIFDSGGDDSLILGANIGITDLNFEKWGGTDLNISFANGGNVVVSSQLLDANKLERIEFADGNTIALGDIQYSLGNVLTGTANDSILLGDTSNNILNGGDGNDYLVGRDGVDSLYGGNGDDWLNGGTGSYADAMVGNAGNDIYYVDYRNDTVTEQLNEGIDTVVSSIAHTLGSNVENLTLSGTGSINGTGNALDNVFRGNSAANAFTGGAGNDTYYLSTGDSAVEGVGVGAGTDIVYTDATYTMGTNIENGSIIGTAAVNLTGNALNNVITGNVAANVLNGGTGADTLKGGLGDDTYIIDVATDVVIENPNEGSDTIQVGYATTAATTLTTGVGNFINIENITVIGTGSYNLTGDAANNKLIGNASANVLTGNAGNDVLNGLAGIDNMSGGLGDDTYIIDVLTDSVTENLNEGTDLVNVAIATKGGTYILGDNLENATITSTVAYNVTGNALNNILIGNAAINTLNGGAGNDTLDGAAGADKMSGGLGNDTYVVNITTDAITENLNEGTDTVRSGVTWTLGTNLENLVLTGTAAINGTGNVLNNYLLGNAGVNTLSETLGGNDIYQGLIGADTLTDTVATGNNVFDGGADNDIITGGAGRDIFIGGLGVDTITTGTGYDVITFNKGDGQDTINASTGGDNTLSLGGNFTYSDLSLTKTGNNLILKMGATDQITLKDWYLGLTNKSVVNLQVIAEAMQGFSLGSADDLRNNKIENFNFADIVSQFDAEGAATNWQLTDARLTAHLQAGSDVAAIGGDLAYQYGMNSNLTGMGLSNVQSVIAAANFGQTAQTLNNPSVWQAEVVKLG